MDESTICLFLPSLTFGGAERVMLNLAAGLAKVGLEVHLCVAKGEGALAGAVPDSVTLVDLAASRPLTAVPALARYLRRLRPDAVIASMTHTGFAALWACRLAGVPATVVIRQESTWTKMREHMRGRHRWLNPILARRLLPRTDHIIAVSKGVAEDLVQSLGLDPVKISVIANPVIDSGFAKRLTAPPPHTWLTDGGPPVIVAVGRLVYAKGVDVLIDAFALLREWTSARLLIFGEGPERSSLERRVCALGLHRQVLLPGYIDNPLPAMARASVFALPSRWEGLGVVLVEALTAGATVVASDCSSGPAEVLDGGRFGRLVPPEDPQALAQALFEALVGPRVRPSGLEQWLAPFTLAQSVEAHRQLLERLWHQHRSGHIWKNANVRSQ